MIYDLFEKLGVIEISKETKKEAWKQAKILVKEDIEKEYSHDEISLQRQKRIFDALISDQDSYPYKSTVDKSKEIIMIQEFRDWASMEGDLELLINNTGAARGLPSRRAPKPTRHKA